MTRYGETEADDLFRQDAFDQGYLGDVHAPGGGRGLRAYYHDNGMVEPQEEKEITRGKGTDRPGREVTGLDLDESIRDLNGHCPACRQKAILRRDLG